MSIIRTAQTATPIDLSNKSVKLPAKTAQVETPPDDSGLNAWKIDVELTIPIERAADPMAAISDFKRMLNTIFGKETGGLQHYHIKGMPKKVADF